MKKIFLKSFGIYLNGREEGTLAFQVLKRDLEMLPKDEVLFFDFTDVVALAPSWCDEFFAEATIAYPNRIIIDNSIHAGLKKSFDVVGAARDITFSFWKFQ